MADQATRHEPTAPEANHQASRADQAERRRRLRAGRGGRGDLVILALVVLVALPIVINAVRVLQHGWLPEGDMATIAIRTHDTFTSHPSLLGSRSTIHAAVPGADVFAPGPALFWSLAVPIRLFGPSGQGLVIGATAMNLASVAAIAVFARRRGGTAGAAGTLALLAVLVWSFGDDIPHDAYNPHIILLPLTLLFFLVWSILDRDLIALPIAVVSASFVAQAHLSTAPIVSLAALVVVAALVMQWRADRRTSGRLPRRTGRLLGVSVLLGVLLWIPVLVQQFFGAHPNISAAIDVATGGKLKAQGYLYASKRLVDSIAWRPYWLQNTPDGFSIHHNPSSGEVLMACVVLCALGAVLVAAVRQRRRTLAGLAAATLVLLAGCFMAASRIPQDSSALSVYNHRAWWPAGMFVWLTLGWAAGAWLIPRVRLARSASRLGLAAAAASVVAFGAISARHDTIRTEHGSASFPVIRRLQPSMLRAVHGHHRFLVQLLGGANALYGTGPGLVSALVQRDYDVRLPIYDKEWGSFRKYQPGQKVDGTLLVLEGARAGTTVSGFRLVALYDARRHPGELDGRNSGIAVPVRRLALYWAPRAVPRVPV